MQFPTLTPLKQNPLLFRNSGRGLFANVANAAGPYFQTGHMGRGAAAGDLDGDGDPDIVVSQTNEPLAVLVNTANASPQSLSVRLVGTHANRDALGSTAILTTDSRQLLRQVKGGGSYLSAGSRELVWGLQPGEKPVSLTIRWPGGEERTLPWTDPCGRFVIRETDSTPLEIPRP